MFFAADRTLSPIEKDKPMVTRDFKIEELEERIAPSAVNLAMMAPASDPSAVPATQGSEPILWHPRWPVDLWEPK